MDDVKDAFQMSGTVEWMTAERWLRRIVEAKPDERQYLIEQARKFLALTPSTATG
jgi:hypothetical protein